MERELLEFDVLIVGAGPAGLSAAVRAAQLSQQHNLNWSIAVIEKADEVGGHILSGAVMDCKALDELLPEWQQKGAPVEAMVEHDSYFYLTVKRTLPMPDIILPATLSNKGHALVRLGSLSSWLSEQAESMGIEILTGFAAHQLLYDRGKENKVIGIATGDMGVDKEGNKKSNYTAGYDLLAKYTLLAEGCRGHLGKQAIAKFELDKHSAPAHYGLGFKEIWQLKESPFPAGTVMHTIGYPLGDHIEGGGYIYFLQNNQVALGLIVSLNYTNPNLSPFEEFNRWKHHPKISSIISDGKPVAYGARALHKGGLYSLPEVVFDGGMLIGCDAGMLNPARIKGIHCAIKHGMIAVESIVASIQNNQPLVAEYKKQFQQSWLYKEHYKARNFRGLINQFGTLLGGALFTLEHKIFASKLAWQWYDKKADYQTLQHKDKAVAINYPKPDGKISFDRLSSVHLTSLDYDEDQPCHLQLHDPKIPIEKNLPQFDEPAQRYCPASVYEVIENDNGNKQFRINPQNCIHCKTCDIKDPQGNINWITPEGGSGPNYSGM